LELCSKGVPEFRPSRRVPERRVDLAEFGRRRRRRRRVCSDYAGEDREGVMGIAVVQETPVADILKHLDSNMAFMYKKFKKMVNPRRRKKPTVR